MVQEWWDKLTFIARPWTAEDAARRVAQLAIKPSAARSAKPKQSKAAADATAKRHREMAAEIKRLTAEKARLEAEVAKRGRGERRKGLASKLKFAGGFRAGRRK
jgi:hypothetical protein